MIAKKTFIVLLLTTLFAGGLHAATALPYKLVIDREGPEEAAFEKITAALVEAKVDAALAKAALKGFDGYIDKRIEGGKTITLYPQTIFEVTKSAAAKGWSAADTGSLLIHIQTEIDNEGASGTKLKRGAIAEINKGKKLPEVIDALEKNEGGADDDDH